MALVTDMRRRNRKLRKFLGATAEKPYFNNPFVEAKKIYVFPDTPHLTQLIRNHFIYSGLNINDKVIKKRPLIELVHLMAKSDLKISLKLSVLHLTVKGAGRQKVRIGCTIFFPQKCIGYVCNTL